MHLLRFLNSFFIYNLILVILFSLSVTSLSFLPILNIIFYVIFHFLIIYLGIYNYRNILYLIYFLYGLSLDIFWINEIGPHLIVFMGLLVFIKLIIKYLYNLDSIKIFFFLLIMQFLMILIEMLISQIMFNYSFNFNYFFQITLISILISYPVFVIFSKIDAFK